MQRKNKKILNDSLTFVIDIEASECCKNDFNAVFDKPCFLEQLRLEMHRAQRSGVALSILLLTKNDPKNGGHDAVSKLLKAVKTIIRETDIVGYIDPHTLGVLLPYTTAEGVKKISEKIAGNFSALQFSITASTYPDQIFGSLTKNGCVSSDVLKFMLEDSINNSPIKLYMKRVLDIVGSIAALLILSPVMLTTALLIKVTSPGPFIFIQTRLGQKGVPFTFYKFRSMRVDTNDEIHRDYIIKLITGNHSALNNGDKEKPLYKMKSDPRITKVGKFIRKSSIDELPQLFNVLKGDMSLVGPRPPLAYEAEKYQAWHLRRILDMKPGITGLWQVDGRSRTGFDEAVRLDIRYIQMWSLVLDMRILLKTVKEVLLCRGAV